MISNNQVVAKVSTKKYLGIQSIEEFLAGEAAIPWLIDGWIQENCLMMVHGPSASGKTFLVLDWCLRLSAMEMQNRNWCGHKTKSCQVLYLVGEGQKGLRTRIRAWQQHHRVSENDFHVLPKADDLDREEVFTVLAEEVGQLGLRPGIIVVDTLHRYFSGDENSARDAKAMLESCAKLMDRFGCAVILVHHTGLAADAQHRARGSSAWRGALDIEVSVKPKTARAPIEIIQRKMKDAEEAENKYFKLTSVPLMQHDQVSPRVKSVVIEQVDKPKEANSKRDKLDAACLRFRNATRYRPGRDGLGRIHIRRLSMLAFLQSKAVGMTEKSARRSVQPDSTRFIGMLLDAGLIEKFEEGWSVVDSKFEKFLTSETATSDKTDTGG